MLTTLFCNFGGDNNLNFKKVLKAPSSWRNLLGDSKGFFNSSSTNLRELPSKFRFFWRLSSDIFGDLATCSSFPVYFRAAFQRLCDFRWSEIRSQINFGTDSLTTSADQVYSYHVLSGPTARFQGFQFLIVNIVLKLLLEAFYGKAELVT